LPKIITRFDVGAIPERSSHREYVPTSGRIQQEIWLQPSADYKNKVRWVGRGRAGTTLANARKLLLFLCV